MLLLTYIINQKGSVLGSLKEWRVTCVFEVGSVLLEWRFV